MLLLFKSPLLLLQSRCLFSSAGVLVVNAVPGSKGFSCVCVWGALQMRMLLLSIYPFYSIGTPAQ